MRFNWPSASPSKAAAGNHKSGSWEMFASASEPAQESFACNGSPGVEDADVAEIKNLKNNNQSENRSPSFEGGGGGSPLQEIDEHYVCDIAMMRIGGEEGLPVTHKAPGEDDDSPSPMAFVYRFCLFFFPLIEANFYL